MSELADFLADLYPERDAARYFLQDAGLDPERVNLDADAVTRWERILEHAWRHGRLGDVAEAAAREFPAHREEVQRRAQMYRAAPAVAAPSGRVEAVAAPNTLARPGLFRYALDRCLPGFHLFLTTQVDKLSEPPERREIINQLSELQARLQNDMREKTYLPLSARPVPASPLAQAASRDPFVFPIHQMILQLVGRAEGGDSASAQIAAVNRRSRVVRDVLKVLDTSEEPLILLGEPGSGKTMTLQQAAITLAHKESRRVFPRAVLFLRLGEFHCEGKVGLPEVLEYVRQAVPPPLQPWLDSLAYAGRLVLFFDGMDEMSRDRYGEHTEALSVFAGQAAAKTLFSCRITDFSPAFVHRRLVLLPFDRWQVAEYLERYIDRFPLTIDGASWKLRPLAQRIARGELPIEADNPFVLWLLCLYLQEKSVWPGSRVDLLQFYNESNYRRKEEELSEDEPPFPEMDAALAEWGRFAYAITERNRGPAIPVQELETGQDIDQVREMVGVGRRCGVLRESQDGHEHLIRFQHHRFQEFFTAFHIHRARPVVHWLDKLDAPRWQETMLNLILMGDTGGAVRDLTDTIRDLTRESVRPGAPLSDAQEAALADRVELSSRILRQSSGVPSVHNELLPAVQEAVQLLADRGNPITQVKMMRACQNLPEIDFIETLRGPLNSPIHWVRNQALILLAGSHSGTRAVGSDLPTEMGYDLAKGVFPLRLHAYYKAAKAAGDRSNWWSLLVGACCFGLNLLLLLAAAGLIFRGAQEFGSFYVQKHPKVLPLLGHPAFTALFALIALIAAAITLKVKPPALWMAILGSAGGFGVLVPVLLGLWYAPGGLTLLIGVGGVFYIAYLLGPLLGVLIAAPLHQGVLAIYLATTARFRRSHHTARAFFSGAWESCEFGVAFKRGKEQVGSLMLYSLGGLILLFLVILIDGFFKLPFGPIIDGMIIFFVGITIGCFIYALWTKKLRDFGSWLVTIVFAALFMGLSAGFFWLVWKLAALLSSSVWGWIQKILVILVCLLVLAGLLFALRQIGGLVRRLWLRRAEKLPPKSFRPQEWKARLRNLDAGQQHILLVRTDHQALSLTPPEFLEVLREVEVERLIKEEPALSSYWDQRDQLEKRLKLERHG